MELEYLLLAGLLAFISTLAASFSGGGASLLLFPMLLAFVPGTYISLFIVSKISAVFMTFVAGRMHFKKNRLNWRIVLALLIPGLLGTAIGTYFLQYQFDEQLFKLLLALFVFVSAVYLLFTPQFGKDDNRERKFDAKLYFFAGLFSFLINILNGILGGTGIFITVFLVVFCRMGFIRAVGYTMAMYAVISLLQASYLMITEDFDWSISLVVVLISILGGYLGTRLQYVKGNLWVKRAAVVMMFAVGIKMLI